MKKVVFSPEAIEDLENIWFYIAQDSPTRADSFLDKLQAACKDTLSIFPSAGSERDYLDPGLLALPYKSYIIYTDYHQASACFEIRCGTGKVLTAA